MAGHRVRPRVAFTPTWEGPIKGYASKVIARNMWRCDRIHSTDDLLQDAYMVFAKIAAKYPKVVEPEHFMALFKRAMFNCFHDHSRYMHRKQEVSVDTPVDATDFYAGRIGEVTNNGYLNALIAEAPEEVRYALAVFEDPVACSALRQRRRKKKGKLRLRENLNMRLRRVTGAAKEVDLTGAIRALLT